MITELLEAAINELEYQQKFEITEFQLGVEPMQIFIDEAKETMGSLVADISKITKFKGIRVREHPSKDAVMYSIALRKKETAYVRQGDVNIG
jgi:hypothetical protein